MGMNSIWHWIIVLVIVVLVFGTKKLRNIGEDLGGAVKGFKKGLQEAEGGAKKVDAASSSGTGQTLDVTPEKVQKET